MKRCAKCGESKPLDAFHRLRDGFQSRCKACQNAWFKTPEGKEAKRRSNLKTRYGITEDEYLTMLVLQDSKCGICSVDFNNPDEINIDHDHNTGKVRQCLCAGCNRGLGGFQDDPIRLRAAADYIEQYVAVS